MELENLKTFGWKKIESNLGGLWKVTLLHETRHLCVMFRDESRELALIRACSEAERVGRETAARDERLTVLSAFVFSELRDLAKDNPAILARIEELNARR